jgi:6-phosphogluconolactonase
MNERFKTIISKDAADVARRVADGIRSLSEEDGPRPRTIALSGGSTPKRLYEMLAQPPYRDSVRWERLELFFGDERSVPPDHQDSNYRMAHEALLSHVDVRAHRMHAEADEAETYEKLLRDRISESRDGAPVFDLILLGMGGDGHTASLFPGTKALDERSRLVVMNLVPQMKTRRMTFTYPLINAARHVWVLVPGADKRERVKECLDALAAQPSGRPYPIVGVQPTHGELVWWLDEGSAGAPATA